MRHFHMERITGIEPVTSAWEADVLPLNYTRRNLTYLVYHHFLKNATPLLKNTQDFLLRIPRPVRHRRFPG